MPIFPAARVRLDVGPADIGRRLTIRHKGDGLTRPDEEFVGVLYRWSGGLADGILRLRRRDGVETGIRVDDIVTARVVVPEVSAFAMQRLAQAGWPPLDQEDLGAWTLRASRGATGRANSVRVGGAPQRSLKAALADVVQWYEERGLPPQLQVTTPNGLEAELDDAGWVGRRGSRLMINSVSRLVNSSAEARHRQDLDLDVESEPNSAFMQLISGFNRETAPEFEHIMKAVRPAAFVYCRNSEGQLLGIGHAIRQGDWCGVTTVQTVPQSRRSGIATAITARLAEWAQDQSAANWYLQFFEDNAAALGFYERLAFTTHHKYEYRWPGGSQPSQAWQLEDA